MIPAVASNQPADDETRELLWRAADRASRWALEGQATVQSRFGNFLLADSFLLLSWATVYAGGSRTASRVVVLAVFATVSALLGAAFVLLGCRYAKYDRLQWDLAAEAESRLPEELRLIDRIHALRREHVADGPGGRYELSAAGVPALAAPHEWLGRLLIAWVADPDGNPVQLVQHA